MKIFLGAVQTQVCHSFREVEEYLTMISRVDVPGPCLFLFPELFMGGFDYPNREAWAEKNAMLRERFINFSHETGLALAGSFLEKRGGNLYNSLFMFSPELNKAHRIYSKIHLFPGVAESKYFTTGEIEFNPCKWQGLTFGGCICFDLRHPELFRMQQEEDIDVFLVPAQWPRKRLTHWRRLLTARAIENQSYVLASNVTGDTILGRMPGYSCLISSWGDLVFSGHSSPNVTQGMISQQVLSRTRRLFNTRRSEYFEVGPR